MDDLRAAVSPDTIKYSIKDVLDDDQKQYIPKDIYKFIPSGLLKLTKDPLTLSQLDFKSIPKPGVVT